mgnify:CR=1 FL=1
MWNWLKKLILGGLNFLYRNGLNQFLGKYERLAVNVVARIGDVKNNEGFHSWKDQAREEFIKQAKLDIKTLNDNWIAIILSLAFEHYKKILEDRKK